MIAAALVQFQLRDPDPTARALALSAIERDAEESHLGALRATVGDEADPALKARMARLERLLTIEFGETDAERIEAIEHYLLMPAPYGGHNQLL